MVLRGVFGGPIAVVGRGTGVDGGLLPAAGPGLILAGPIGEEEQGPVGEGRELLEGGGEGCLKRIS